MNKAIVPSLLQDESRAESPIAVTSHSTGCADGTLGQVKGYVTPSLTAKVSTSAFDTYAIRHDPALRGAILLQHPTQLVEILSSSSLTWLDAHTRLLDARIHIRRYKPGRRCLFDLELILSSTSGEENRRVIGKMYASNLGQEVYKTLQELWSHGFGIGRFNVPQPLAYDSEWRLLFTACAKGESLDHLLLNQSDASKAIVESAKWLLELHRCGASRGKSLEFKRLHKLGLWQRYLGLVYPEAERLFADIRGHIEAQAARLCGSQCGPTHCDYSPEHLLIDNGQITGVDFDQFGQYDPLYDVAHFVVYLRYLGLSHLGALNHFDCLAELFQNTYKAYVQEYSVMRVRLFMVVVYLKLIYINAFKQRTQNWKQIVDILLHEAHEIVLVHKNSK